MDGFGQSGQSQVAVDDGGRTIVSWQRTDFADSCETGGMMTRVRSAAGAWGPPREVTGRGCFDDAHLSLTSAGSGLATWTDAVYRMRARAWSATARPGRVFAVAPGERASEGASSTDRRGTSVIAWQRNIRFNTAVRARVRSSDGRLGPIATLSPPGQFHDTNYAKLFARMLPGGDGLVVWAGRGRSRWRLYARTINRSGRRGPLQTLSAPTRGIPLASVAIGRNGEVLAAWTEDRDVDLPAEHAPVLLRVRAASGRLGPVTATGGRAALFSQSRPSVATAADGRAVIAWSHCPATPGSCVIQSRMRLRSGVLGPVLDLAAGGDAGDPQVALDAAGNAFVAWTDIGIDSLHTTVFSRRISATGRLDAVVAVPNPGRLGVLASEESVAAGPSGRATILVTGDEAGGINVRLFATPR